MSHAAAWFQDCCICYDALTGPSSYGEGKSSQFDIIQLNKCSHMFHRLCLLAMYDSSHNVSLAMRDSFRGVSVAMRDSSHSVSVTAPAV